MAISTKAITRIFPYRQDTTADVTEEPPPTKHHSDLHVEGDTPDWHGMLLPGLLVILAIMLVGLLTFSAWEKDRQFAENKFLRESAHIIPDLSEALTEHEKLAMQLGQLMASTGEQRLIHFERLAQKSLAEHNELELVAWLQPEQNALPAKEVIDNRFQFTVWRKSQQTSEDAGDSLKSLDHSPGQPALAKAIVEQKTTASQGVLVFNHHHQRTLGAAFFHPVFADDAKTVLDGVIKIGIRFDLLTSPLIAGKPMVTHVFDITDDQPMLLFAGSGEHANARYAATTLEQLSRGVHVTQPITVADRTWSTWVSPASQAGQSYSSPGWTPLISGVFIALSFSLLMLWWQQRLQKTHSLLVSRSRRLDEALRQISHLESESQHLSQEAAKAHAYFHEISATSEDFIFELAVDGKVLFASPACSDLLGYSPEDVLKLPTFGLISPFYLAQIQQKQSDNSADKDTFITCYPLLHRNGSSVWVESNHRIRRDKAGNPTHTLVIARDISDRFNVVDELIYREWLFRSIFDGAAIGMALCSATNGKHIKVNWMFCTMLGYTRTELLDMRYTDITHPADLELTQENARQIISGQTNISHIKKRYLCKNGNVMWVQITASAIWNKDGQPTHLSKQIQYVSSHKKTP